MPADSHTNFVPNAKLKVVYLGPVAPHWEVLGINGEREVVEDFRQRINARLLLLPPHDPQFKRNRERIIRDTEREGIVIEWDLGIVDDDYDL